MSLGWNILFCVYVHVFKKKIHTLYICKANLYLQETYCISKAVCVSVYKSYMILSACLVSSPCTADILSRMQHVRHRRGEPPIMTFLAPYDLPNKSQFSQSLHTDTDMWRNSDHLNNLPGKISISVILYSP